MLLSNFFLCPQTEDTRKVVRSDLTSSRSDFAVLKQRLVLLLSWPALPQRAQDAVRSRV